MAKNTTAIQTAEEKEESRRYISWLIRELETQAGIRAGEALRLTDEAWLEQQEEQMHQSAERLSREVNRWLT
jgi:hypothetical protein